MLPYINVPFEWISKLVGTSIDELKLITLLLASYPLAGLLKRIPDRNPGQKNLFIISVSLFYLVGLFDLWTGIRTLFIASAGAYLIAAFVDGPLMPWIGFVFMMGHMSINHIIRQSIDDASLVDITGAQMVLVMKLTAFCWNVHDGRLPDSELSDFQKERAIKKMPGLLEYTAYALFFPGLMAGPAFDYAEYTKYISTTMFELPPGTDPAKAPPTRKKRRIPRSGTPAMLKAAGGLAWIWVYLQISGTFSYELLISDKFLEYNIVRRIFTLYLFGLSTRTKYYGVWSLTEGACILSGIGYAGFDPKTGKAKWDRLVNVRPYELELAQNTRAYLGAWNINTNSWLRNYVYLRVTPKGKKPGFRATLATFVTSAFWHGFYPGYYMAFVLASLLQNVAKNGRRLLRPFFLSPTVAQTPLPSKIYYDIFSWLVTQLSFAFAVTPFVVLYWTPSLLIWQRVYFYPVIGLAVSYAFMASPAKAMLQRRLKARLERPELQRSKSDGDEVFLGVPVDMEEELQEIVDEIRAEVLRRKQKGMAIPDVRTLVKEKLNEIDRKLKGGKDETASKKEL